MKTAIAKMTENGTINEKANISCHARPASQQRLGYNGGDRERKKQSEKLGRQAVQSTRRDAPKSDSLGRGRGEEAPVLPGRRAAAQRGCGQAPESPARHRGATVGRAEATKISSPTPGQKTEKDPTFEPTNQANSSEEEVSVDTCCVCGCDIDTDIDTDGFCSDGCRKEQEEWEDERAADAALMAIFDGGLPW